MLFIIAILLFVLVGVLCSHQFRDRIGNLYDILPVLFRWTWIFVMWAGVGGLIVLLICFIYGWCMNHTKELQPILQPIGFIAVMIIIFWKSMKKNNAPLNQDNSGEGKNKKRNSILVPDWIGWTIIGLFLAFLAFVFYLAGK